MAIPYNQESSLLNVKQLNNSKFDSPNVSKRTGNEVKQELEPNQAPLGSQFRSYELNKATNFYTLDPFQYSITKFKYNLPGEPSNPTDGLNKISVGKNDFQNDPGLIYEGVDFERLLPAYTSTKKSVNDFPAQSYHRFEANEGYFNPNESVDNRDLWYYGADNIAQRNGFAGGALNVQEVKHIVFPEPQRGGLNSRSISKYSWVNTPAKQNESWESANSKSINNNSNCQFFNYNNGYSKETHTDFNQAYGFDSTYCRNIGISGPTSGSMPFMPKNVN
jgi:hypothetical protein